ncbi:fibronectin type III domain-containing protein [bacterium]|nr:fibronectin type III domain-containing protein [bacterium]
MRKLIIIMTLCGLISAFIAGKDGSAGDEPRTPTEIVSLRTVHSETFEKPDGARMTIIHARKQYNIDPEAVPKEGRPVYRKIDLTVHKEACDGFTDAVKAGPYTYRFDPDNTGKGIRFERDGYSVTYTPDGDWTGKMSTVKATTDGIKDLIELSAESDSTIAWRIGTDARVTFSDGEIMFRDENGNLLFRTPAPWAIDSEGTPVPVTVSFVNGTLIYALDIPAHVMWPITVDPSTVIGESNTLSGFIYRTDYLYYTYARNPANGSGTNTSNIIIGRRTDGSPSWTIYRSSLLFDTSILPDNALIDSAKVKVVLENKAQSEAFNIHLVKGTYTGAVMDTTWFNDFDGWAYGVVYTPISIANTVSTNASVGDTLVFTLNSPGLTWISISGTTKFMLLSSRDIDLSAPPGGNDYISFGDDSPYIMVWYHLPPVTPPTNFTMTALDSTTIACSWTDLSTNENIFCIMNCADSTIVDTVVANATADTISGLDINTKYVWMVAADSSGVRGYSDPDSTYTLLPPPNPINVTIMPVSSDTLHIAITPPSNPTTGITGMEVDAISGYGSTDSGWKNGAYSYFDGGLNPEATYVYRLRLRNGEGIASSWTPNFTYQMNGLDTLLIYLGGDGFDDYNVDFGSGQRDSTVVRVGKSDSGQRLDGFISFSLPWSVVNGGIDAMYLTMTRAGEGSSTSPAFKVYGIPVRFGEPVEDRNLGQQDSTAANISWTVTSGTGARQSPNLRAVFRAWQDIDSAKDFTYDFGLRLDDNSQTSGVRAVFLDCSNPSYADGTWLTVYYTPGQADTLKTVPTDFTLTTIAPDSLRANWTDTTDSEYGFIIVNLSDSAMVAGSDTLPHDTTSVDVGGLTPNTVYEWFVRAFTSADETSSEPGSGRTDARTPGVPGVTAVSETALRFVLNPLDNPLCTEYAVQDSISGLYVDGSAEPDTLKAGPPGEWGWKTYEQWGSALGDTLTGLAPNSLHVIRAKARTSE